MTRQKSEYSIQTVDNAFRILEAFDEEIELGVSALSRRLELHKNNVFRLLATLEQRHYIEQCAESDRYRLGPRCLQLGRAYTYGHSLLRQARPVLERLSAATGETSHVAALSAPRPEVDEAADAARAFEVVHLDGEQPRRQLLTALRTSERLRPHACALGKVLLGCADEATRERYHRLARRDGLEQLTESTICDSDKLFDQLRGAANEGFALDLEEFEQGMRCAAAPVYDGQSRLVAALSVSGPACRMGDDLLHRELVPAVVEAAEELSARLGRSAREEAAIVAP